MVSANSRDIILQKLHTKLDQNGGRARQQAVKMRLMAPPEHLCPSIARGDMAAKTQRFCDQMTAQGTIISTADNPEKIPYLIGEYLQNNNHDGHLRAGQNGFIQGLNWRAIADFPMEITYGAATDMDKICISHAVAGAAETGTLFLASSPANPTTLNFLPELHIVLIDKNTIFGSYEEAWGRLREQQPEGGDMPRCVNWISGPSRTADIEQTLVRGAHGPIDLLVIMYPSADNQTAIE